MVPHHREPVTLLYLHSLHQFTSLAPAVLRFTSDVAASSLQRIFTGDLLAQSQSSAVQNIEVTDEMALVSRLVLPENDYSALEPTKAKEEPCSSSGLSALEWIQQAVFPMQDLPGCLSDVGTTVLRNLLHSVRYSTVLQAHQASDMCLAALLMSVGSTNCLAIMQLAAACGCTELHRQALDVCLADPAAAVAADVAAFTRLPREQLLHLLGHDGLRAEEDQVLLMLVQWVDADSGARSPQLVETAGLCLRPSLLSYQQLVALDEDPAVCKNVEAITLVAGLFIKLIMEVPSTSVNDRPRSGTGAASMVIG